MKEKKEKEKEHTVQNRNGKFSIVTLITSLVTITSFGLANLYHTSSTVSELRRELGQKDRAS